MYPFLQKKIITFIENNITFLIPFYQSYLHDVNTVLDIGCGSGLQDLCLKKAFPTLTITGLDVGDYRYPIAKNNKFVLYAGDTMPFRQNQFDVSMIFLVLHHTKDPKRVVKESARVTKKNIIILEEVFHNPVGSLLLQVYDVIINFCIYGERISWPHFHTEIEWKNLFKEVGITKYKQVNLPSVWWRPAQRILYILEK